MDDPDIIRQIKNGNADAYALLVGKYHRPLLNFIFRIADDEGLVEDMLLEQDRSDPVGEGIVAEAAAFKDRQALSR